MSVPDWTVTISVWLRWGRGPGQSGGRNGGQSRGWSRRSTTEDNERPDRPRMHAMVSVHSTGPSRPAVRPGLAPLALTAAAGAEAGPRACPERSEGGGPTSAERTKPESYSSQSTSEIMSVPVEWDPAFVVAYALAERFVGWLMSLGKRTKPESFRKDEACKNMSPAGERTRRNPNGSGGTTAFGGVFRAMRTALAPRPRKECS